MSHIMTIRVLGHEKDYERKRPLRRWERELPQAVPSRSRSMLACLVLYSRFLVRHSGLRVGCASSVFRELRICPYRSYLRLVLPGLHPVSGVGFSYRYRWLATAR